VSVADGSAHAQKDSVKSSGSSFKDVAKIFMLFMRGVQLALRSSVFTVFDLDEVKAALLSCKVFRSVLSRDGCSGGGWRCC
jgi:hypothetical protein